MTFISPLYCDNYINAGNYFQEQLSHHSNLVIRTALVFAKIVGRGQDVLLHTSLGSIKLIVSTAMAIYSIPAAAFDSIPTHHKIAKQAFRHFGFVLLFMADIPLSLAHILNIYPKSLCERIQQILKVSPTEFEFDQVIDGLRTTVDVSSEYQAKNYINTYKKNKSLKKENIDLKKYKENIDLEKYIEILQKEIDQTKETSRL
ncbi:MAG: hypothetical protein ACH349_01730 [Candidatus Rhabdochlamydia sp.]|jgi:hypothetical protein